ncbi:hypothetical protein [Bacillus alkalicola]|nr:hypothetical protein [Bacillus alkalicola]
METELEVRGDLSLHFPRMETEHEVRSDLSLHFFKMETELRYEAI